MKVATTTWLHQFLELSSWKKAIVVKEFGENYHVHRTVPRLFRIAF